MPPVRSAPHHIGNSGTQISPIADSSHTSCRSIGINYPRRRNRSLLSAGETSSLALALPICTLAHPSLSSHSPLLLLLSTDDTRASTTIRNIAVRSRHKCTRAVWAGNVSSPQLLCTIRRALTQYCICVREYSHIDHVYKQYSNSAYIAWY